ncbi:MAG: hypothetical protein ABJZ56_13725 [Paracoccaceae bacterium]
MASLDARISRWNESNSPNFDLVARPKAKINPFEQSQPSKNSWLFNR